MDTLFVFMIGAIVGSFLNVCIYRMPKNKSIVMPASHCPHCNKAILWHDNIPVISYLLLRGRCRNCKTKISLRYVVVELLTAAAITGLYCYFGLGVKFYAYSVLAAGLIIATFVDFEIYEIPDEISIGGMVAGFLAAGIFPALFDSAIWKDSLYQSLLGILVGGGSIYLIGFLGELVFKKEAMGGGDVKLMAMIGAFIGWKMVLLTFFIAPVFGSIVGIALKIKDGREIMPYGPYLSLAAVVSIFFGHDILNMVFGGMYLR